MKEMFKYTFLSIAEWKKFLVLVLSISILTIFEAFPVISIVAFLFEKLIYLSVGVFLIYLVRHSSTAEIYYENLQKNPISTFLFHFIPSASGILFGLILIGFFWISFFIIILQLTGAMFILINPHNFLASLATTTIITKILIGFYFIYFLFFSYIFLGKLGEALTKENFKEAFISTISSLIDFNFWIKTFNLKYFLIYIVWSFITVIIYSATSFVYIFEIFPMIQLNPNLNLIIIPIFVAITTIISYFTFFSAYFSYKAMD